MSMHLHHPALSLNGKKRGKIKFRNAAEAQRARELDESWKEIQKKWGLEAEERKRNRALSAPPLKDHYSLTIPAGRDTKHIPSLNNGVDNGTASLSPAKVYTGSKMKGIGTMHKSNSVPIFSDEEAEAIAHMRR